MTLYKIDIKKRLDHGSARFGVCEICAENMDTTYLGKNSKNANIAIFAHYKCLENLKVPDEW